MAMLLLMAAVVTIWSAGIAGADDTKAPAPATSSAGGSGSGAKATPLPGGAIASTVCPSNVVKKVYQIYSQNRDLFDQCVREGKYQVFPFSGKWPTPTQIGSMAQSRSCVALFTACTLADLPQCDIGEMAIKSVVETLLKIAVDVDAGEEPPSTERFRELIIWRRDVNLAQQAGAPFDSTSTLYGQYSKNLWKALTKYNVRVLPDLKIEYQLADGTLSNGKRDFTNITSGSLADAIGTVEASQNATVAPVTGGTSPASSSGSKTTSTTKIHYMLGDSEPVCTDQLASYIVHVNTQNKALYETCATESGYQFFPYSGFLPTDSQIAKIAKSKSCIYFMHGLLKLQSITECNLGGIGLKANMETLLMVSQDLADCQPVLTTDQLLDFIKWRYERNIAQQSGQPYDSDSASAIDFDHQLNKSTNIYNVKLVGDCVIYSNGKMVGGPSTKSVAASDEEEERNAKVHVSASGGSSHGINMSAGTPKPAANAQSFAVAIRSASSVVTLAVFTAFLYFM
ncbi:TPA: LOW QUALITY PROTEIN: hypothetical protein N0F65_004134 [Lagenidium giganteum]|uniref:Elicitin n=1 Tax=Lagenidium giganteum TaxID=4803 RepID=A0AAV2ZEN3_9STRA|nr:TPA: LOW QUALITY PROTEIN: hypothetical protein N0F65_004134 [Lagenidium giganteum]